MAGQNDSVEVGYGDRGMRSANVGREYNLPAGIEDKPRRRPAPGGCCLTGRTDVPQRREGVDPGSQGGARKARDGNEFRTGPRLAITEQLKKVPGTRQ